MAAKPIPEGYHSITPRLFVRDAEGMVEFLRRAFDGCRRPRPDPRSPFEVVVGDSILIVSEAGPRPATSSFLYLYVPDADAAYAKAIDAGARTVEEPRTTHYGDRRAMVEDRFGNTWQIATHVEDVTPEEMRRRLDRGG